MPGFDNTTPPNMPYVRAKLEEQRPAQPQPTLAPNPEQLPQPEVVRQEAPTQEMPTKFISGLEPDTPMYHNELNDNGDGLYLAVGGGAVAAAAQPANSEVIFEQVGGVKSPERLRG